MCSDIERVKEHPDFHTSTDINGQEIPPAKELPSNTMLITHVSCIILWALDLYLILLNNQVLAYLPYLFAYSPSMAFNLATSDTPEVLPTIILAPQGEFLPRVGIGSQLDSDSSLGTCRNCFQQVLWILKTPMSCLVGYLWDKGGEPD